MKKEILTHYLSGTYGLSNAALYVHAVIILLEKYELGDITEDLSLAAVVAMSPFLVYSGWRAYYDTNRALLNRLGMRGIVTRNTTYSELLTSVSGAIASLLKTIGTSASLYQLCDEKLGHYPAVAITAACLPGNLVSQFSFLGQKLFPQQSENDEKTGLLGHANLTAR